MCNVRSRKTLLPMEYGRDDQCHNQKSQGVLKRQSDAELRMVRLVLYRTEHERHGHTVDGSHAGDVGGGRGSGWRD